MVWLFFGIYTVLSGAQQGIICWLLREYVPPGREDWINAAYHSGGLLIYALLIAYAAHTVSLRQAAELVAGAVVLRVLLFDVSLNAARAWFDRREGRSPGSIFEVGTTAVLDRAIRALAPAHPQRLRITLWLLALLAAAGAGAYFVLAR